ncbi:MAG: hypothetical protein PVH68_17130, partial [Armatimonadota bacterium]
MSTIAILSFAILHQAMADTGPGHHFFRAGIDADRPVWGLRDGIRFGVWPGAVDDRPGGGGPRGLIRVGYPIMPAGAYALVNFIAIEPIVQGQRGRGYSELEPGA